MADNGAPTPYPELIEVLEVLPRLAREKRRRLQLPLRAAAEQINIPMANLYRFEQGFDAHLRTTVLPILGWVAE